MQKKFYVVLMMLGLLYLSLVPVAPAKAQGAAPSEHLVFYFPSDAIVKMHKIKITQTAFASYFEMNSFNGGYGGLQHTPDSSKGSSHTLISSLWDPNTAGGIYSQVDYAATNTYTGRFGGEGDGYQSINPYNWVLNTWYNQVIRAWKSGGRLHVATFIQNLSSGEWFHTATLSVPDQSGYLGQNNDAFLENWTGSGSDRDGRYVRKAFFKDCWNLNTAGVWQKHTSRYFSANAGDSARNGIYDRAFNSGYDSSEDAYFMVHGGSTTPDAAFGTGRTLNLPAQTGQGDAPTLTTGEVSSVSAVYQSQQVIVSWTDNSKKSPQLSATVEILDNNQQILASFTDTLPERRQDTLNTTLPAGTYTAKVTIRDIFNQQSTAVTNSFIVADAIDTGYYRIKNAASGKYLAVEDSATDNLKNIVQYTGNNSSAFEWKIQNAGSSYNLVNKKSSKAIDLPASTQTSGTQPIQYSLTGGTNQQWNLIPVATDTYLIQSNMSNHFVLDNPGSSSTDGTKMIIYATNGTQGSANQRWILEPADQPQQNTAATSLSAIMLKTRSSSGFSLWPSPARNKLKVRISNPDKTNKGAILIYDNKGVLVKKQSTIDGASVYQINIGDLPAGIYHLIHNKDRQSFIKK